MAAAFSPAQPAPVKLGAVDPVERWGWHTLQGNQAFERGEDIKARQSYSEALAVAEELMVSAARAHDARAARFAPALYGISCNDIIALARRQGDGLTAGIFLCKLAGGYLTVMESADAPASLRARCVLHSRLASAALCSYFEERGMWDAAESYTTRANAAFFSVQRVEQSPSRQVPQPESVAPSPAPLDLDPLQGLLGGQGMPPAASSVESPASPAPPRRGPPPLPPGWGERQSELPATIWSDPQPALDLTPPQPPPRKSLRARLLEWVMRSFRRPPGSPPPALGPALRVK